MQNIKKTLGVFSLVMINVVAVDSLRTLPFSAEYGLSLVFFYVLGGIVFFLPIAFISAELATGWPNKGGVYVWVREAFGEKWGFVIIWLQWVYNIVWYPTILSFVAGALAFLFDPALAQNKVYVLSVILTIFWGATFVNFFGMKASSAISTIGALAGTLIPMLFIIFLCAVWLGTGGKSQIAFSWHNVIPKISNYGDLAFFTAILFGLIGVELSAVHADEVDDPGRAYPRAISFSTLIIFSTLVLASLAIAIVVPQKQINPVTGFEQAFSIFFKSFHLNWMQPVITVLIVIGGIGGVATWIIGPTKGLLVATRDGSAPPIFGKVNKHDVPVVILLLQAVIFTLLCSVYLFMPTVNSSYWVLTAMTAQLAMLVYIGLFAAAIYLRYSQPKVARPYKIPMGNVGIWVLGLLGILSSSAAVLIGFFPPSQIAIGSVFTYELILVLGVLILTIPPVLIYAMRKPSWG